MKTKVLIFESSPFNSQIDLNKKIEEFENDGYIVISTQVASGNSFSKYTSNIKIVITFQK